MSLRIRLFVFIITAVMLTMLTKMIKEKKVDLREALVWYVMGAVAIMLDIFPGVLGVCATGLGIAIPANMIFMFAIVLLIITVFILTTTISRLSTKLRRLTQELALLKKELEETRQ